MFPKRISILYALLLALFISHATAQAGALCNVVLDAPNKHALAIQRAAELGITYLETREPGFNRVAHVSQAATEKISFDYFDVDGAPITDEGVIKRLNALAIPPAYKDVWFSTDPSSHLQALAYDAKGKPQYYYQALWSEITAQIKFERTGLFGRALPHLREVNEANMNQSGFGKDKIMATITELLEVVLIRIGNKEGVDNNESYGLTTMLKKHVTSLDPLTLHFKGKSNKEHSKVIKDPRIAKIVSDLLSVPGENLFQYVGDDGQVHEVDSGEINQYIKKNTGGDFSAKDFRTWMGTFYATAFLSEAEHPTNPKAMAKLFNQAASYASNFLGNTPDVCRKSYINPAIFKAYQAGLPFDHAFTAAQSQGRSSRDRIEAAILEMVSPSGSNKQ